MRRFFTVGALALAGRRANAVGAVRITLTPDGLDIELVRVAGFALGFALGGVAEPVSLAVPYTAVRGLVREGPMLYLALDPVCATPHNRFALAHFMAAPDEAPLYASLARARARWASMILPAPLGALAAALAPGDLVAGTLGRASFGLLAALIALAALRRLTAWLTWGGPRSDRLRDLFEAELVERLALAPAPSAPVEPELARRLSARRDPAQGADLPPLLPLARPAESVGPPPEPAARRLVLPLAAAAAAALGIVGVMAFLAHFAAPNPPAPAVDRLLPGLGAAVHGTRPEERPPPETEPCVCTRADSPLWKGGIPQLAVLTFHGDEELAHDLVPAPDRKGRPQYDFDLAVVNDGARPIHDVRLTPTFARRDRAGRRVGAVDRGLFWGGALAPGAAVKWKVSAPGTEWRLDASVTGTLAAAHVEPAAPDAFAHLLTSRFRAVRAHAALMLAYLRDPRADGAVRALEAQGATSKEDAALLARIRRAAAPVIACDVKREGGSVEACVFNASSKAKGGVVVQEIAAGGAVGRSFPVEVAVPVHEGRRFAIEVPEDLGEEIAVGDSP